MPGKSNKTEVLRVRLPVEVVKIIKRRVNKQRRYKTISGYLSERLIYDLIRKHRRYDATTDNRKAV